jgi:plasmid stability protein
MGDLLVRNIPDAMKHELAAAAERAGVSLSDKAKDLLRQGLRQEQADLRSRARSGWEALRHIAMSGESDDAFAEIMRGIEADRKKDTGRPVEFPE